MAWHVKQGGRLPESNPNVIIIAGPNGAGKSSTAPNLLGDALKEVSFINADAIARGLSAFNPEGVAYAAGRIMLERIRTLAAQRVSFGFETTLAARSYAHQIDEWKAAGYEVNLLYLWVRSPETACERVKERARLGGHTVDEQTIRVRWTRSAHNLIHLYVPRCTRWMVYDNSASGEPALVARGQLSHPPEVLDRAAWDMILGIASKPQ